MAASMKRQREIGPALAEIIRLIAEAAVADYLAEQMQKKEDE